MRAIVAGERDAHALAALRDPRCRQSEAEIAAQLSGHWRADHLFSLQQALKMYDTITERLQDYDREIQRQLADMIPPDQRDGAVPPCPPHKARKLKTRGQEPLRQALYRMTGVDLTTIDAIGVDTVSVVVSEYGADLRAFPTEQHFVSHIRLAPHQAISGGKPVKNRKKKPGSATARVAAALRMAAVSMRHSETALGAYLSTDCPPRRRRYRRLRHRPQTRAIYLPALALGPAVRR